MLGFARIADLSLASDGKAKFTVYNIHMNGFYHSSLRYSQLLELHTEVTVYIATCTLYRRTQLLNHMHSRCHECIRPLQLDV